MTSQHLVLGCAGEVEAEECEAGDKEVTQGGGQEEEEGRPVDLRNFLFSGEKVDYQTQTLAYHHHPDLQSTRHMNQMKQ